MVESLSIPIFVTFHTDANHSCKLTMFCFITWSAEDAATGLLREFKIKLPIEVWIMVTRFPQYVHILQLYHYMSDMQNATWQQWPKSYDKRELSKQLCLPKILKFVFRRREFRHENALIGGMFTMAKLKPLSADNQTDTSQMRWILWKIIISSIIDVKRN